MKKGDFLKVGMVYVLIVLIALYMDLQEGDLSEGNIIYREEPGGDSKNIELYLDVEGVLEKQEIVLEVDPMGVTKEVAEEYFLTAMKEIDLHMQDIKGSFAEKTSFANGMVKAEWNFSPQGIIAADGSIRKNMIPEEGVLITVTVLLSCDNHEKIYSFPFWLERSLLSPKEQVETELNTWIDEQGKLEGKKEFQLPDTLGGIAAKWSEKKEYISFKVICLELISVIFLIFAKKKEKEDVENKNRLKREMLYPEIVNQLLILLEAGMTTRQAWNRIAYQYVEKKKYVIIEDSEVYDAIVQMDRRLAEGENERFAYENFGNQMNTICYRRLMRLIVHNLEKGSKDLCQQLSLEARQAYSQRVLLARKMGEEASTKMLIPMLIMMLVVMGIVMVPAILSFLN